MPDKTKTRTCAVAIVGGISGAVAGILTDHTVFGLLSAAIGLVGSVLLPTSRK